MSTNSGTSSGIRISGAKFSTPRGAQLHSPHQVGNGLKAPQSIGDLPSTAFNNYDASSLFTFSKITPPDYGDDKCIARITGVPINEPDFVSDFHFIGLMRATDKIIQPKNSAVIGGSTNTPSPTS